MRIQRKLRSTMFGVSLLVLICGCCAPTTSEFVAPSLLSVNPLGSSSGACPTSVINAAFSEAMNPSTINSTTVTLAGPGSTAVAGQVTYTAATNTATFSPASHLLAGTVYTGTISTGARDQFGNQLASSYVWSFTTASNGCNPPPTVTMVTPASQSVAACPNATISATFSEAMNPATINGLTFLLSGPGNSPVAGQVTYNAATNTALFTPSANLAVSTLYTATIGMGAQDLFGNSLAANFVSSFTTAANGCHPAPLLTSITPLAGATGVCPTAAVVATFNEAMNPSTINATTFTLSPGVVGTVSHDVTNTIFTLTPSSSLALNKTYTATISTGAQDTFGNPLASQVLSNFTTASNGCNPVPLVNAVSPASGATGVCPNQVITATFSEAMNPLTINGATVTLTTAAGTQIAGQVSYSASSNMAIFTPAGGLALNTTYKAAVLTGVQDVFGNTLAANFTWSFATGANSCLPAAPPITVTPANGATGICPQSLIAATFAQAMNPTTINAASFTVTGPGSTAIAGTISADATGKIYTFNPTTPLALNTTFTATISTAARDPFGNPLASNFVWTFTTGASTCSGTPAKPVITATSPLPAAIGICSNSVVTATFNEAMNPATINAASFTLSNGVTGTVTLDATGEIAIFTPSTSLPLNTKLTATITTAAQDTSGNALASNYVWTFTTSALACQAPVPLGTAANFEILAGSTVTNTGGTIVTGGNLGLSPGSAVTGFPPGTLTAPAVMHLTDQVAAQAELDLTIAFNYAAGLSGGAVLPADLTGRTFTPGLYTNASTVTLSSGNVTLDAQGNSNAVFIFQIGSSLSTLGSTQVLLVGGAQAKNVFWQVGSSATLGTASVFEGTILSLQSITLNTGATLQGRALASNAAVTLDNDIVTAP